MIAIVKYGLGNLQAFVNIYKRLGIPAVVAGTPDELAQGDKIVLPGVGAFDWAMALLNESGLRGRLDELVLEKKRPVLGICVGMQIMACSSEEGHSKGLGWIDAEVKKFRQSDFAQKAHLPHMGWNDVFSLERASLFHGMNGVGRFYFLHSYYFLPRSKDGIETLALTGYNGFEFVSAVRSENIFGVQFHPEKSHQWGIQLLKNFAEL